MPRISRVLAILVAAIAFAACAKSPDPANEPAPGDPAPPAAPAASADTGALAAARGRWEARKPTAYAYTLEISCFCIQRGVYAVEARDGRVASVRTEAGESVPEDRLPYILTVDQLFQRIGEAAGEGTPTRIVYDPALGYPAEAEIGTLANDAGTLYRIRGLRPL